MILPDSIAFPRCLEKHLLVLGNSCMYQSGHHVFCMLSIGKNSESVSDQFLMPPILNPNCIFLSCPSSIGTEQYVVAADTSTLPTIYWTT